MPGNGYIPAGGGFVEVTDGFSPMESFIPVCGGFVPEAGMHPRLLLDADWSEPTEQEFPSTASGLAEVMGV